MRALYFFNTPPSLNNGTPESLSRADNDSGGTLFSDGGLLKKYKKYKTWFKSFYYYYYYNTYLQNVLLTFT